MSGSSQMTLDGLSEPSYSYWLHYDLKRDPFLDIDESRLKGLSQWDPHFELLLHLIQYSNVLLVVTGQTENGKLTLVDQFALKVSKQLETIIIQSKPNLDPIELLETLCNQCGFLNIAVSDYELAEKYALLIEALSEAKRKVVLLFEDAQSLPGKTLELCFKLVRQQADHARLHMVLFGDAMIDPLLQNIAVSRNDESLLHSVNLKPFTLSETEKYLRYCLTTAGMVGRFPFKPRDIKLIHKQSGGLLGATNQCAREWLIANAHKQRKPWLRFWKTYHLHLSSGGLILLALIAYSFGREKESQQNNTAMMQMTRIAVTPEESTAPLAVQTMPAIKKIAHHKPVQDILPAAPIKAVPIQPIVENPAPVAVAVPSVKHEIVEVHESAHAKKKTARSTARRIWQAMGQFVPEDLRHYYHGTQPRKKRHKTTLVKNEKAVVPKVKIADIAKPVDELPKPKQHPASITVAHHQATKEVKQNPYVPPEAQEQYKKTVAALMQSLPPVAHKHIQLLDSAYLRPVQHAITVASVPVEHAMKIQYVPNEPMHYHEHKKETREDVIPHKKVVAKNSKTKNHPHKKEKIDHVEVKATKKVKVAEVHLAKNNKKVIHSAHVEMKPHAYTDEALSKAQKKKIEVAIHSLEKKPMLHKAIPKVEEKPIVAKLDIIKVDLKPTQPNEPEVHVPLLLKPIVEKAETVVAHKEAPAKQEPAPVKPVIASKPAEPKPKTHIAASVLTLPQQMAESDQMNPDQLDSYRSTPEKSG